MCSFSRLLWKFRHIRLQIHIHLRKNEEAGYGAKGPESLLSSILVKNDFLYFCYGVPPPSLSPHVSILDFVPLYSVQFSLFLIEYLSTLHIKNVFYTVHCFNVFAIFIYISIATEKHIHIPMSEHICSAHSLPLFLLSCNLFLDRRTFSTNSHISNGMKTKNTFASYVRSP